MNVQIYVTGNKGIFCINILYISRIIKCILGQKKNRSQSINFTERKRNRIYEIFVRILTIMITIRRYIIVTH